VVDDGFQIVKTRLPFERRPDAIAGGDDVCRIARPAAGELDLEIDAGDALYRIDHLEHRKATAVTTIERRRGAAGAQMGERIAMRGNEIGNVDVIPDAGAVRRRVVGAENIELRSQPKRGFDRHLDEVGGPPGRVAGAAERVGARDVEVTQDHTVQPVGGAGIAQHDFSHQFRGAVRRRRHGGIVLACGHTLRIAVDRCGRGEDEMMYSLLDRGLDQRARVRRIIAVIAERIANRVRHDDRGSEMDDGVDPVLSDQFGDARLISSVANQERRARRHRPIEAGREIVEHHHPLASVDERMDHVAADIAGTARDQDRHCRRRAQSNSHAKPILYAYVLLIYRWVKNPGAGQFIPVSRASTTADATTIGPSCPVHV
jgi:hypothetical protein